MKQLRNFINNIGYHTHRTLKMPSMEAGNCWSLEMIPLRVCSATLKGLPVDRIWNAPNNQVQRSNGKEENDVMGPHHFLSSQQFVVTSFPTQLKWKPHTSSAVNSNNTDKKGLFSFLENFSRCACEWGLDVNENTQTWKQSCLFQLYNVKTILDFQTIRYGLSRQVEMFQKIGHKSSNRLEDKIYSHALQSIPIFKLW